MTESDADAGSDANTTDAVEAAEVANPDEKEFVLFGSDSSLNARRFEAVLESETLSDIIVASEKAIHGLHLKERDIGSITMDQKCKSLQGRWMVKEEKSSNNDADADAGDLARDAKRNRLIKIVGKL